ncbi:MAG: hypothetical protein OJF49_001254 [Ktedonobacterales bacterium]|nr:MAG: hypothetical protein OJF49_001254 [Ktedonobacterales bacterium]
MHLRRAPAHVAPVRTTHAGMRTHQHQPAGSNMAHVRATLVLLRTCLDLAGSRVAYLYPSDVVGIMSNSGGQKRLHVAAL